MATRITSHQPIDLAGVKDDGIKSLVLLAASLGFHYDWRSGKPILLYAADQTQISLSSETSINAGVFQGKLNQIMTHYDAYHYTPTIELIDAIIKQCKPNKDQQRLLRLAVGETIEETRKRMRAQEAGPATDKRNPDEHLTQRIELPTSEPVVFDFIANDVTMGDKIVEPQYTYKPHEITFGSKNKPSGVYYYYNSESVLDRVDANGEVTYVCRYCHEHGLPDYVVKQPAGIGVHWGRHVKAGDVEKHDRKVNTLRSDGKPVKRHEHIVPRPGTKKFREATLAAEKEAALTETIADVIEDVALEVADAPIYVHIEDAPDAPLTAEQKIWAIRNIIDDGQVERLQAENDRLATRVASLESDLRALKDLIGGIK